MTDGSDATLQSLRLKYNAALAAHQGRMRALTEASMAGTAPSRELVEAEVRARRELDRARERLLAGMTEAITGLPAVPAPHEIGPAGRVAAKEPLDPPS